MDRTSAHSPLKTSRRQRVCEARALQSNAGMPLRGGLRIAFVIAGFMTLFLNAKPAAGACVDSGQGPCYRYWGAEIVLLGEVKEKVLLTKETLDNSYRLDVSVLEGFRGIGPEQAAITFHVRDGECGLDVNVGDRVLFYASRGKDAKMWASSDSTALALAEEGLAYARLASAGAAAARVYGDVVHRDIDPQDGESFTPMPGVTVRVRRPGFDASAVTDVNGDYSMQLPGAGTYDIEIIAPRGLANRGPSRSSFRIEDAQGCFRLPFQLTTNGRIRGVVLNGKNGRPVPNLVVHAEEHYQRAVTDSAGAFDIGPLSAGTYELWAETGSGDGTLLAEEVSVAQGRPTQLRPLVASGLTFVTLDLTGLPGDGWILIAPVGVDVEIGRQENVTVALEPGASLSITWVTAKEVKAAKVTISRTVHRVKLSQLTWRSEP
jgi:hypothetical protein